MFSIEELKKHANKPKLLNVDGVGEFYCKPLTPRLLKVLGTGEANEAYHEKVIRLLVCDSEGNAVFKDEDTFEDVPLEIQGRIVEAITEANTPTKNH